ncbi:MAG: GNAT family N-acetyltransferase [Bacilli bacterium]
MNERVSLLPGNWPERSSLRLARNVNTSCWTQNIAEADAIIAQVKEQFVSRNLTFTWQLGPSSYPKNLTQHLLENGFVHDETEPGMALDLAAMNVQIPTAANAEIQTVRTETEMDRWIETWACGAPRSFLKICKAIHGQLTLSDDSPWQYYVGKLGNEPVATALLYLGEQAAVVHWIATLPQVRRKGMGTAITLAVLREARARGYSTAVLTASDDGVNIYRRIGFKEYCKISKFKYSIRE